MPKDQSTPTPNFNRANALINEVMPFIKAMRHYVDLKELEKEMAAEKDLPNPEVVWSLVNEMHDLAAYLDSKLLEEEG